MTGKETKRTGRPSEEPETGGQYDGFTEGEVASILTYKRKLRAFILEEIRRGYDEARQGRPLKESGPGKRASLTLKVTPEMKQRIDEAARQSGRTQSQEGEARLEQAFSEIDGFGGPDIYQIARLAASAFLFGGQYSAKTKGNPDAPVSEWITDEHCYQQAVLALIDAIASVAPSEIHELVRLAIRERAKSSKTHSNMTSPEDSDNE